MIGIRKVRTGITVITLSLILLVTTSNSMSNGLKPAQAASMFGAAGDWGCSSNAKNTVSNIVNHNAPTTLSLGDMSYQRLSAFFQTNSFANPSDFILKSMTTRRRTVLHIF